MEVALLKPSAQTPSAASLALVVQDIREMEKLVWVSNTVAYSSILIVIDINDVLFVYITSSVYPVVIFLFAFFSLPVDSD